MQLQHGVTSKTFHHVAFYVCLLISKTRKPSSSLASLVKGLSSSQRGNGVEVGVVRQRVVSALALAPWDSHRSCLLDISTSSSTLCPQNGRVRAATAAYIYSTHHVGYKT